jgi:hypothetical protein
MLTTLIIKLDGSSVTARTYEGETIYAERKEINGIFEWFISGKNKEELTEDERELLTYVENRDRNMKYRI